jgi:diguanylate cyclase (GGDEF)-like protein/PAS domain S-box-containing protein
MGAGMSFFQTEQRLEIAEARYRAIVEDQTELICRFLSDWTLTFVNEAYCRYFNKRPEELIGTSFMPLIPKADHENVKKNISALNIKNPIMTHEHRVIAPDGSICWQQWTNRAVFDKGGNLIEYQAVGRDITRRKQAEEKLALLNKELLKSNKKLQLSALRDPQTGLYNHHYMAEIIESEFHRAQRYAHPFSAMMLDIDYFKSVNDVYGHQFGDIVLKQFAQQLKKMVRPYDIVVRFAGEEFVILSPGISRPHAVVMAQRILDEINLHPFGKARQSIKIKLSIAVASYPEDKVINGTGLVNFAEKILAKAKENGGNRVYSSVDLKRQIAAATKPIEKEDIRIRRLKLRIDKLTKCANESLTEAIFALAKTIEFKDHYTGEHAEKMVSYVTEIARMLRLNADETEYIRQAAILHDLGKIGISENILLKPTRLNRSEIKQIRRHSQIGVDIIRPIHFMSNIVPLILYHHERWDGTGYPFGLKGEEIPLGARIIAIADVYQALISDRPYRKAYPLDKAMKILKEGTNRHFDPAITDIFLNILKG